MIILHIFYQDIFHSHSGYTLHGFTGCSSDSFHPFIVFCELGENTKYHRHTCSTVFRKQWLKKVLSSLSFVIPKRNRYQSRTFTRCLPPLFNNAEMSWQIMLKKKAHRASVSCNTLHINGEIIVFSRFPCGMCDVIGT